jgi:hypothetical protein
VIDVSLPRIEVGDESIDGRGDTRPVPFDTEGSGVASASEIL